MGKEKEQGWNTPTADKIDLSIKKLVIYYFLVKKMFSWVGPS